jgi:hypothetical protein
MEHSRVPLELLRKFKRTTREPQRLAKSDRNRRCTKTELMEPVVLARLKSVG